MTRMAEKPSCPVCDADVSNGGDLRVHLLVEHRKSELAGLLVGEVDRSREEVVTA